MEFQRSVLDKNIILVSELYKFNIWNQLPAKTQYNHFYIESRGGEYDKIMIAGINYICNVLAKGITHADIDEAKYLMRRIYKVTNINEKQWRIIVDEFDGKLPLTIRTSREGAVYSNKNVICTIENTDPRFAWLPGFLEPFILKYIWYSTTIATKSFNVKKMIYNSLMKTCTKSVLSTSIIECGSRSASSSETGMLAGMAHVYNFRNNETIETALLMNELYPNENNDITGMAHVRDHSTTIVFKNEDEAFLNSIYYADEGTGISLVLDSVNYEDALNRVTSGKIYQMIMRKKLFVSCVPDSGHHVEIISKTLDIFEKNLEIKTNSKGYKVLPVNFGIIYGDGLDIDKIEDIIKMMEDRKWSTGSIKFTVGGKFFQNVNRDTLEFAMKCSLTCVDGVYIPVSKKPKDSPMKRSREGYLGLVRDSSGEIQTVSSDTPIVFDNDLLRPLLYKGKITYKQTLSEIQKISNYLTVN